MPGWRDRAVPVDVAPVSKPGGGWRERARPVEAPAKAAPTAGGESNRVRVRGPSGRTAIMHRADFDRAQGSGYTEVGPDDDVTEAELEPQGDDEFSQYGGYADGGQVTPRLSPTARYLPRGTTAPASA